MAQIGSFVLLLALVLSGYCFVAGIVALVRGGRTRNESEKPPDARDRDLPAPYKFAVLWSGQEGSLLFWSLLLAA